MQSVCAWVNMAVLEDSGGEAEEARRTPKLVFCSSSWSSRNEQRLYRYPCNLGEGPWDGVWFSFRPKILTETIFYKDLSFVFRGALAALRVEWTDDFAFDLLGRVIGRP